MIGEASARLGILAYGSLIDDPGEEIAAATAGILRAGVITPFPVEFARSSHTRAGAPTLVPMTKGGARVPARVFVLRDDVSEQAARDMLWRRETGKKGRAPTARVHAGPDDVVIDEIVDFHGVGKVLYARIASNIVPLTPQRLAELALNSARCAEVAAKGRDGISYLMDALHNGIDTPLSAAYEAELLRRSGAATLADALEDMRVTGGALTDRA
jgi:hypothetical protein